MLGQTLHEYIFIRTCITLLRLVAPASLLYLFACLCTRSFTLNEAVSRWMFPVALSEASFYVFVYRTRKNTLQKCIYTPPLLNRQQREALFLRCSQNISFSGVKSESKYPSGWFSSPNLKRENLVEWILWALYSCGPDSIQASWKDEIDAYVHHIEQLIGIKVEDGRDEKTKALKLTLDPVKMVHRPLIWYMIVALVDLATSVKLYSLGFHQHLPPNQLPLSLRNVVRPHFFPPRLFAIFANPSPSATDLFSYWYRPHKSSDRDPIVFIHGIGIGLHPYIPFFQDLIRLDPKQGILLIELLPISMHICSTSTPNRPTSAIPPRQEMLNAIYATVHSLEISRAVLASHSYGTVIAAHIIRDLEGRKDQNGQTNQDSILSTPSNRLIQRPNFTSHLLIDPIPFLLHLPNVAFNFLYRAPRGANEWQLWYFASRDPDIAFTLGRCFFWAENILWKEDLAIDVNVEVSTGDGTEKIQPQTIKQKQKVKFAVVLSGKDQIVPAPLVRKYLTGEDEVKDRWTHSDGSSNELANLEVLYYPSLDHAMIFDTKQRRKAMVSVLDRFTGMCSE